MPVFYVPCRHFYTFFLLSFVIHLFAPSSQPPVTINTANVITTKYQHHHQVPTPQTPVTINTADHHQVPTPPPSTNTTNTTNTNRHHHVPPPVTTANYYHDHDEPPPTSTSARVLTLTSTPPICLHQIRSVHPLWALRAVSCDGCCLRAFDWAACVHLQALCQRRRVRCFLPTASPTTSAHPTQPSSSWPRHIALKLPCHLCNLHEHP